MRTRLFAFLSMIACAVPAGARDNDPKATTKVVTCAKVTLIDLEAKDKPVGEVLDEIARKMGYEKIIDKEMVTPGMTHSCSFRKKPAWECMVEICEKHDLVFGGAGIGEDFGLGIYKSGKWKRFVKPSSGLATVFIQGPPGTPFDDPFHRPFSLRILSEPGISCSFKEVSVVDQKNARGKPCSLLSLQPVAGGVQESAGKDNANPWPALSSFTVQATAEIVKKKIVGDVSGLSNAVSGFAVNHEGKSLFTIEKIGDEGNFVKIEVSAPSESTSHGVMQGGWGNPTWPAIEAALGFRMDFVDAKGAPVGATVISWKGDGAKAVAEFKFTRHLLGKAGGIGAITVKFSKALEKDSEKVSFAFKDLLK